jgi:hypothetical protein
MVERTADRDGQLLLEPDYELEGWWTSLDEAPEAVIKRYQAHATHEQFHSEIKTDLDLERLPSGKFATNDLILHLAQLAYNILRLMGQLGMTGELSPVRHPGQAAPAAHRATRAGAPCGSRDSQGTADHPRRRAGYRAHDGAQDAAEPSALSTRNAMLTVNRRHSIHKQFQATRDRQICRAWRVERHDKTGRQHRSARWVLAITGLRKPTCTGRMIKKCSLAVIGKVSAPASRIQVSVQFL